MNTVSLPALEQPYLDLLQHVSEHGAPKGDRTGTGTKSVFGHQMRFDLSRGFPLLTTKKVFWKGIAYELLWFLRGGSNAKWLQERGVTIWNKWAAENGDLGPVYGVQWRTNLHRRTGAALSSTHKRELLTKYSKPSS